MTGVIISNSRMRVLNDANAIVLDTDEPLLNCVFRQGGVSLPQRQAITYISGNAAPVDQTDTYDLAAIPAGSNVILGMLKLTMSSAPDLAMNEGRWVAYSGEMPICLWAHNPDYTPSGGSSNTGHWSDYVRVTSMASMRFSEVAGRLILSDRLIIRATQAYIQHAYRTRPACTLEYKLYCGNFV